MSASERRAAVSVWPYRLLPYATAYIALRGDRLRLERKAGQSPIDLHVSALETFTVRRSWFWKRLTTRTTDGAEYSVGGLRHESVAQLHAGVLETAKAYAVMGGIIMYRRGGGERSRVALQNRTTRRLP